MKKTRKVIFPLFNLDLDEFRGFKIFWGACYSLRVKRGWDLKIDSSLLFKFQNGIQSNLSQPLLTYSSAGSTGLEIFRIRGVGPDDFIEVASASQSENL